MAAYKSARKRRPAYVLRELDEDELVSILINVGIDPENIAIGTLMAHMRNNVGFPDELPMKSSPIKSKPMMADDGRWLAAGETVEIAGFVINSGLLYVGQKLSTHNKNEPSLIDSSLEVIKPKRAENPRFNHYGYYQMDSYQELSPPERWQFLAWLAGGRKDPQVPIGFVSLFLAGLERRVLVDAATDSAVSAEIPVIIAELHRLLAIHVEAYLFKHHASRLIDYLEADGQTQEKRYLRPPPNIPKGFDGFPFAVRVGLGQLAKDKKPLMADWALAWFRADGRINKPTMAYRFADVFDRLYVQVYQQEYAAGFLLPMNKTKLTIDYRAISSALNRPFIKELNGLPDMAVSRAPLKKLSDIAFKCHEILQPYSRFLSRTEKKPDSLDAALLLPTSLWPESLLTALEALRVGLDRAPQVTTLFKISQQLLAESYLAPIQIVGLLKALEVRGIGLEPDVTAIDSTIKLTVSDAVVLFATVADDNSTRLTPVYMAASLTVDLAVFVAQQAKLERTVFNTWMQQRIESWTHLSTSHLQRLNARVYQRWLRTSTSLVNFKKRMESLADNMRLPIVQLLAQVAQSQGMARPNAIKYLERIYTALQINNQQLYTDLHLSSTTTTSVKTATGGKKSASTFTLDAAKIAQLQQETAQVSALLADVFVEDGEDHTPAITVKTTSAVDLKSAPSADCLFGLDEIHSLFLRQVAPRLLWPRTELLALATQCDLMLDGALEYINEVALDTWDEPLFDGDDPIDINPELIEKFFA